MPELPTIAEAGLPGFEVDQWYGVITGAKVPPPIIKKLNAAIVEALKSPDVVQRLAADGSTATSFSPEAFDAHIRSEMAKWRKLVKDVGLVLDWGGVRARGSAAPSCRAKRENSCSPRRDAVRGASPR